MRCICCLPSDRFNAAEVLGSYALGSCTETFGAVGGSLGGRGNTRLLPVQWMYSRDCLLCWARASHGPNDSKSVAWGADRRAAR